MNNSKSGKKGKLRIVSAVVLLVVIAAGYFTYSNLSGPYDVNAEKKVIIEIPKGASLNQMAEILKDAKLIKNETVFKLNVKRSGRGAELKAGEYLFTQAYTNEEIINDIADGKNYHSGPKVTVKEGKTSREIIDTLVGLGLGQESVYKELISSPSKFRDKFSFLDDEKITSLEGFLYPSTYYCNEDDTEQEIIEKMLSKFDSEYSEKYRKIQEDKKLDFYDVIKMASIVEKEAVLDEDRPLIASVFYNRLKIDMALQSDATIQYALGERKQVVSYDDLKIESPYNSYKYKGLPPTPIANPSIESIEAALEPADTDYLYFVAKTDGGGNNYAKTYKEHLKNEKRYKEQREKNK